MDIRTFKKWQKEHPNFMTPDVLRVKQCGHRFIELSEGTDTRHRAMYGVTVVLWNQTSQSFSVAHDLGLNRCFSVKAEAVQHFKDVSKVGA